MRGGGVRLRAAAERFRSSLFFFPVLFVGAAIVLGEAMLAVDRRVDADGLPELVRTTVDSARAVLATITAATITVAAVVFSVTVVSAQLAASQLSPPGAAHRDPGPVPASRHGMDGGHLHLRAGRAPTDPGPRGTRRASRWYRTWQ